MNTKNNFIQLHHRFWKTCAGQKALRNVTPEILTRTENVNTFTLEIKDCYLNEFSYLLLLFFNSYEDYYFYDIWCFLTFPDLWFIYWSITMTVGESPFLLFLPRYFPCLCVYSTRYIKISVLTLFFINVKQNLLIN